MKNENIDKLNENNLLEFKRKLRYVLNDLMFEKIELKNPLLFRIGLNFYFN